VAENRADVNGHSGRTRPFAERMGAARGRRRILFRTRSARTAASVFMAGRQEDHVPAAAFGHQEGGDGYPQAGRSFGRMEQPALVVAWRLPNRRPNVPRPYDGPPRRATF